VAVEEVTPLPTDDVTAGETILRLVGVDTVAVDVMEELTAVLALPDEIKVPWIVREVLRALSVCSLPSSLAVCTDVLGVAEAEVEDGASRIGPIGARLARDPMFTVIPPAALPTCNSTHKVCSNEPCSVSVLSEVAEGIKTVPMGIKTGISLKHYIMHITPWAAS
jgi:hypothetical protein